MKLKDKVAVVTGSGRGIGRAIALAFAREGAKLVLMARTAAQVEETCREAIRIGTEAVSMSGDISRKADIENLVRKTLDRFGPPDILVNNASVSKKRAFTVDYDDDVWQEVIRINLVGTYLSTKYFLKTMIPRKTGRIINISSIAGKSAQPFNSPYAASKHGILGLTKTVALEMGMLGVNEITVNAICPGPTKTDMLEGEDGMFEFLARHFGETREEIWERRLKGQNIQARMLDPEEIAAMAVFLASDEAKGITGQAINVDGGFIMH
jgi:NAD(P)-dependent dehydrogenase (short-subunit alcohol dehydrogenase family)